MSYETRIIPFMSNAVKTIIYLQKGHLKILGYDFYEYLFLSFQILGIFLGDKKGHLLYKVFDYIALKNTIN